MERISFFIDGFNVYHSLIYKRKYVKYLWLDCCALAQRYARKMKGSVADVFYFSALAYWDQVKVQRHLLFIDALKSRGIKVVMGNFKEKDRFCNNCRRFVMQREEKQTDVNIALHLLNEAYNDSYDTAMIMTNDTDLIPAIKMLRHVFPQKKVGVLFPINRRSHELIQTCNFIRYTKKADFSQCQFPDPHVLPSGRTINKPTEWR